MEHLTVHVNQLIQKTLTMEDPRVKKEEEEETDP